MEKTKVKESCGEPKERVSKGPDWMTVVKAKKIEIAM